jgi:thiamine-phosphate pyrophosphorylase
MDRRLVGWGRAVKARNARRGVRVPPLWLFTDARRLPDPRAAVASLPRGLCGVVLRHDGVPGRARLGRDLARLCRDRRLTLVVAGDPALAASLRAGVHLRGGRGPRAGCGIPVTASVHDARELVAARRGGATMLFLSPVFPTVSHPGAAGLGVVRWAALARRSRLPCLALGGMTGETAGRLPLRLCYGAGAIGGWL